MCPYRHLLLTMLLISYTQCFLLGKRQQGCLSNASLHVQQTCRSCSQRRCNIKTTQSYGLTHYSCSCVCHQNTTYIPIKAEKILHVTRKTHHNILYYGRTRGDLFAYFCQPWRAEFTSSSKRANTPYSHLCVLPFYCHLNTKQYSLEHSFIFQLFLFPPLNIPRS